MKIVCDACTAKYSIADEKVAGKVFKIRCKKCENIIVVRGTTAAPAEAEQPANQSTKVFDNDQDAPDAGMSTANEGEWHVVIDQEQVGPMTSDEVRVRFGNGELDTESYIWKEGFADWERIPDVAEFADLDGAAADGAAASDSAAAPADDGGMFGTPVAAVAPAAAVAAGDTGGGGLFGGDAGGGVDLFGGGGDSGSGVGSNDLFGNSAPASEHTGEIAMSKEAEAQLKGQRNENSVLFSLGNLAALASDAPKAVASSSPTPGVSNTGGSEGSGLIDIRSMASVYLADKGSAASPGAGVGSADDLPVFSTSAFESASPVLMPTHSGGDDKKMVYTLLAVIAGLVVVAGIFIVIVLGGDDKEPAAVAANTKVGDVADSDKTSDTDVTPDVEDPATDPDKTPGEDATGEATAETTTTPAETPTETETKAPVEVKAAANRPTQPLTRKEKRALAKVEKEKRAAAKIARANKPERTVPKETPSRGGSCDEITCLVDPGKACCKKYAKKSKGSGSSNSNLPESLSKPDVKAGIAKVKGRVTSCGDKHNGRGIVTVKIKISGSGKVTSASASGGSSALRSCVSSAVKRAKFKKTQNGRSVNYPFRF